MTDYQSYYLGSGQHILPGVERIVVGRSTMESLKEEVCHPCWPKKKPNLVIQTNAILPYNYSRGIDEGLVTFTMNSNNSDSCGLPFDNYFAAKVMTTTGGRADLCPLNVFDYPRLISYSI